MRRRAPVHLPWLITAGAGIALVVNGPIPQFADYHQFADRRTLLGIPHAADVLSNAGFAIVGLWGLWSLWHARRNRVRGAGRFGYGLFAISLLLTAAGSAFYHLAPDNARLVWDRLPIALACAGLLAAVRAESRGNKDDRAATFVLAVVAVLSVVWWHVTERAGAGDLRPYLFLQALPLVLIPLWQTIYDAPRERRMAFGVAILLYIAAKMVELNDHAVYAIGGLVSGHTLKHVLATVAAAVLVAAHDPPSWRPVQAAALNRTRWRGVLLL